MSRMENQNVKCPAAGLCRARKENRVMDFPVKTKAKERRIEKKTILVFRDEDKIAIGKRDKKGLLAGLMNFRICPDIWEEKNWRNTVKKSVLCLYMSRNFLPQSIFSAMWNGI